MGLTALAELMQYGAGAAYDTTTGTYVDLATGQHYADVGALREGMYASEAQVLAGQEPQPRSEMIGPYSTYPVETFRTLPSGVIVPEFAYQRALAEGTLEDLIHYYTAAGTARTPEQLSSAPLAFQIAFAPDIVAQTTPITRPNQALPSPVPSVPAPAVPQPSITTAANGTRAVSLAPGISEWIRANRTLLIAGGAGLAVLLLVLGRRGGS